MSMLKKHLKFSKSIFILGSIVFSMPIQAQGANQKIEKNAIKNEQKRLKTAVVSYKRNHDYQSLLHIFQYIRLGMTKNQVEALLGLPDYSPCDGQFYYGSNGICSSGEGEPPAPCGIVIVYDTESGSNKLKNCWFGSIRE